LIDKILDAAGQKGTGKWTAISALDLRHARHPHRRERVRPLPVSTQGRTVRASAVLQGPKPLPISVAQKKEFVENVRSALYCSKIISYAQGYMLLRAAAKERGWKLNWARSR
jgi:6-phosphogluconate dehydrogenase